MNLIAKIISMKTLLGEDSVIPGYSPIPWHHLDCDGKAMLNNFIV